MIVSGRRDGSARDTFIGERAGGARNHAFAAGDAGGIAHRRVQIECDAGGIPLPMRPRTKLFLISSQPRMQRSQSMQASWSTAMASEESSRPRATDRLAKRGAAMPAALRQRFQFAIAGVFLPGAGRRMVGHQKFQQRFAGAQNFWRLSFHFQSWLDGPNAGSGEDARAGVHYTQSADAHGSFILQMAQELEWRCRSCARRQKHWCPRERTRAARQS